MSDLQRLAALVQAEHNGSLKPEQRAVLKELRERAQKKNQTLAQYIEPVLTMGSSAIAEPVSGFVGLAGLPYGGDVAASAVQRSQEALTYKPKSQAGQKGLEKLGGFAQGVADKVNPIISGTVASVADAVPFSNANAEEVYSQLPKQGLGSDLGDMALKATNSPAAATVANMAPSVAMELLGLKGLGVAADVGKLGKQFEIGDIHGQAFGQRGIFGGIRAKGADLDAQAKAEKMLNDGASRDDIWQETGWFKDVDGKWKFEISDALTDDLLKGASIDPPAYVRAGTENVSISEFMEHPELWSAYPDEAAITLRQPRGSANFKGQYDPALNRINLADLGNDQKLSTGLHEVQHAIQEREGFASGGSANVSNLAASSLDDVFGGADKASDAAEAFYELRLLNESVDAVKNGTEANLSAFGKQYADLYKSDKNGFNSALRKAKKDYKDKVESVDGGVQALEKNEKLSALSNFDQYQRLAGEAEARNVQTRLNMTPEERRATPPWATLDVPEDELIVRGGSGSAMSKSGAVGGTNRAMPEFNSVFDLSPNSTNKELFVHGGSKIEKWDDTNRFGDFLFFSNERPDFIEDGDFGGYAAWIDPDEIVEVENLFRSTDDAWDVLQPEIKEVMERFDVDEDTAYDLMTEKTSVYDLDDIDPIDAAEDSWYMQEVVARSAKKLGFKGVAVNDEFGTSYMLDMVSQFK